MLLYPKSVAFGSNSAFKLFFSSSLSSFCHPGLLHQENLLSLMRLTKKKTTYFVALAT